MLPIACIKRIFPEQNWGSIWLVGGTVRDLLLDKKGQDLDLVVCLTAQELSSLGFRRIDPVSGTPVWFQHIPETGKIEITCINDPALLADELHRRDFTVNALAMPLTGELIDLFDGVRDIQERRLRTCSTSSFCDDPVRIMRAFRFAADGWEIAPETVNLLSAHSWEHAFSAIPVERFSREMQKALEKSKPERFFMLMLQHRIGITYLPELFSMPEVPAGPLQYHPEGDLLTHSLQVMQRVANKTTDSLTRFCALFHDLGKLSTDPEFYPRHHGHDEAGFKPAQAFCKRLRLPAEWGTALAWTCRLHTKANNWLELRDATKIKLAGQASKAGIAGILPLVSAADKPDGSGMAEWETVMQVAGMSSTELGIDHATFSTIKTQHRSDYVLQKRVEQLRHTTSFSVS